MKRWAISLTISVLISCFGLAYFISFMVQDGCLDSGGRWLGYIQGCDGGNGYSMQNLVSPITIAIFTGIILGITSAIIQFHTMLFSSPKTKT